MSTSGNWDDIAEFWGILEANLAQRHRAAPVHSAGDIQLLHSLFPGEIVLITARVGQMLAGGTVLFAVGPVLHMQYTATTSEGRAACVTDLMMERGIDLARDGGHRYFDFGISTLSEGQVLDENLYQFKISFGAGGVTYDHYEIDLQGSLSLAMLPGSGVDGGVSPGDTACAVATQRRCLSKSAQSNECLIQRMSKDPSGDGTSQYAGITPLRAGSG